MKIFRPLLALALFAIAVPMSQTATAQKSMCKMPASSMSKHMAAAPLDINTATKDQLMTIKGLGDKYSDAIIKGRPYSNKSQLTSRGILPEGVYKKVSPMLVAKQK